MKEWFTSAQLSTLPSLPSTEFGIRNHAAVNGWLCRPRQGRGGGREYHISNLPEAAREALVEREIKVETPDPETQPSHTALPPIPHTAPTSPVALHPAELADWQRRRMDARHALLAEVDRLAARDGRSRAVAALVKLAAAGELPPTLQRLVSLANARAGARAGEEGKRTLSRPTLFRWLAEREKGAAALAPRETRRKTTPPWAAALLDLYRRPQKPSLQQVMDELGATLAPGVQPPSYDQARRYVAKLSPVARNRGRMGPKELKAIRGFVKRTTDDLQPLDVVTADGHTADFKVAHPIYGKPFRPEITTIICVKTRKAIGWTASLKESGLAVLEALSHAVATHGIPAIFYTDNGSGYCNQLMSNVAVGSLILLGITHKTSLPYNSQARGVIERAHQSIWIRAARTLPAYVGRDMDREAEKKCEKLIAADIKERGASDLLMTWPGFMSWAQRVVDGYNARPHRGLPRITDPASGKSRHMSPDEAWQSALEADWAPMRPTASEVKSLFRPMELRAVRRCTVNLLGNQYYSQALEPWHGRTVGVSYDIHDGSRVWITDSEGRHICIAEADANAKPYFPRSAVDLAAERRARTRMRTVERHRQEIEDELGPRLIEAAAEVPLTLEQIELAEAQLAKLMPLEPEAPAQELSATGRPLFRSDEEYVAWMRANPDELNADDHAWLEERKQSWEFRVLHGFEQSGDA